MSKSKLAKCPNCVTRLANANETIAFGVAFEHETLMRKSLKKSNARLFVCSERYEIEKGSPGFVARVLSVDGDHCDHELMQWHSRLAASGVWAPLKRYLFICSAPWALPRPCPGQPARKPSRLPERCPPVVNEEAARPCHSLRCLLLDYGEK